MVLDQKTLQSLPTGIGVYLFYQDNQLIYVGKAVNLKARIVSHFQNAKYDTKEKAIIEKSNQVKTIVTNNELSAVLLEAELIKKYQPKYNVRWKDDKNFLYIKITIRDKYPKILVARKENDNRSLYFGPFSSTKLVNDLLREIRKIVPFCSQKKLTKKPCFYSKIGLCQPCPNYLSTLEVDKKIWQPLYNQYCSNIKKIIDILKGKFSSVFDSLKKELREKVKKEEYEEALRIRNKIDWLTELIYQRSFNEEELLLEKERKLEKEIDQLLKKFRLIKKSPVIKRIECFDVSNFFGQEATGSMVVFTDGLPDKKEYKRFKIKMTPKISDLDMLREVIKRRLLRKEWKLPNILIVDGGKPQVRVISQLLKDFNLKIPLIGIAKHPDRIVIGSKNLETIKLESNSPLFNLIRQIRDESHRFAKKYHLFLRKKKNDVIMKMIK